MVEETWTTMVMVARTASVLRLPETMDGLEYEIGILWFSDFRQLRFKNSPLYGLTHLLIMGNGFILTN
jgi:hypothetical protein